MFPPFIFILFFAIFAYYFLIPRNSLKHQPPGPWGLPIVGHLLFFEKNPAETFIKWKKTYGPIVSVKFGPIQAVVLNDVKLIKEAFSLQAVTGRLPFKIWEELSQSKGISFNEGPHQMEQRTFAIKTLKQFGAARFKLEHKIQEEISIFVQNLKNELHANHKKMERKPIIIHHFFRLPVANCIWQALMGERFDEKDPTMEYLIGEIEKTLILNTMSAQMSLFFSWFATILGYSGKEKIVSGWRNTQSYVKQKMEEKREDYVKGEPKHFTHAYFDKIAETSDPQSSFHESMDFQKMTTTDILTAGIDTSTLTMDWILLYMARNPQVQKKLQEEIDSVLTQPSTGKDSLRELPSLCHRAQLPFTEAAIKELTRIISLTPLVVRTTVEDIDFHGYKIPKKTMIVANLYGIHHDPDVWKEPDAFLPERFLSEDKEIVMKQTERLAPFGWGKRICIGEGIAQDQIFLFTVTFFQTFSVSCTDNVHSLEGKFGIVRGLGSFELNIEERCF